MTDQGMPGLSGTGLVEALRIQHLDVPTILCTGSLQTVDKKQAAALAINSIALKPLSLSELARLVRDVLDGSAA
jgi:CheY-like chemotaxis protein